MPKDNHAVQIFPSMMCADVWRLADEVHEMEAAGIEGLHFDIMDAHFVPNMPVGMVMLEHLRSHTAIPFDVHLMVDDNDFFIERLAPIGLQYLSVHVESATHLDRTLGLIKSYGIKAGAALNPATPLDSLTYVLEHLDFVLIMTVNPGYAGQNLVPSALRKIADCRAFLDGYGLEIPIQVDGNVSFENIPHMVAAGADILVGGTSSVFHKDGSIAENTARAREGAAQGLNTLTR
jgi:ribulose-phosphate 3-epimerase